MAAEVRAQPELATAEPTVIWTPGQQSGAVGTAAVPRPTFAGSSVSRGKSTSFYDGQGRFSGSAIKHGNSTSFYDGRGRYTGSSINTGPRR
jgi:hypothetical protein